MKNWISKNVVISTVVLWGALLAMGATYTLVIDDNAMCSRAVNFINNVVIANRMYLPLAGIYEYRNDTGYGTTSLISQTGIASTIAQRDLQACMTAVKFYDENGYTQGEWELVESVEIVASGAVNIGKRKQVNGVQTSYNFASLTGNSCEQYKISARIVTASSDALNIYVRPNNDSANTNYLEQGMYGSSTTAAAFDASNRTGYTLFNSDGQDAQTRIAEMIIFSKSGYMRTSHAMYCGVNSGLSVGASMYRYCNWENTADEITALNTVCDVASGMGVGTKIELYQKIQ